MEYIQISRKLRIQRPGMEHLESVRPFDLDAEGNPKVDARGEIAFLDLDTPTIIDIDDRCVGVDIVTMLRIHAIKEMPPKKRAAKKTAATEPAEGGG